MPVLSKTEGRSGHRHGQLWTPLRLGVEPGLAPDARVDPQLRYRRPQCNWRSTRTGEWLFPLQKLSWLCLPALGRPGPVCRPSAGPAGLRRDSSVRCLALRGVSAQMGIHSARGSGLGRSRRHGGVVGFWGVVSLAAAVRHWCSRCGETNDEGPGPPPESSGPSRRPRSGRGEQITQQTAADPQRQRRRRCPPTSCRSGRWPRRSHRHRSRWWPCRSSRWPRRWRS